MTTDSAFVLRDESMYREWGYVAMSRGREENRLYVVMGEGYGRDEVGGTVERPRALEELVWALERSKAKSLAFDDRNDSDSAGWDLATLRSERDDLYSRLERAPRDVTDQLRYLRRQRESLQEGIDRQRLIRDEVTTRFEAMSRLTRARRRDEVQQLQRRIASADTAEKNLQEKLPELGAEQRQLETERKNRERWLADRAPDIRRLDRIESELSRREAAVMRGVEVDVPRYIENELGPRPESRQTRNAWRQGVLVIERYRDEHGIKDPKRALGKEKDDDSLSRVIAEEKIRDAKEAQRGRSADRDFGIERRLELTH